MKIGIDFDGTCVTHEYPNIGKDIGAVPVLKQLVADGHVLNLNTMRCGPELEAAVNWFKENGIPLNGINEDPGQGGWTQSPKVYANLYIDDAALGCPLVMDFETMKAHVDWKGVEELIRHGILHHAPDPVLAEDPIKTFLESFIKINEWTNISPDGVSMCRSCKNSCKVTEDEREKFAESISADAVVKCLVATAQIKNLMFTQADGYCKLFESAEV